MKQHNSDKHEVRQPKTYFCNICDAKYTDQNSLKDHKQVHIKKHKCKDCLYKANSDKELNEHIARRHAEKYECEWCDFVTHSKANISEHERKDHNITKNKKTYKCQKCENIYRYETDLVSHIEEAHSPKPFRATTRQGFSYDERRKNGFCRFWNHTECSFGERCKFLHEEAPHCR